jgi:hypothetical protein
MGAMQRHPWRGSVTGFLSCPGHVRSANLGQATVILDCCTGRVNVLLGSAHRLWLALARTCHLQTAAGTAGVNPERANEFEAAGFKQVGRLRRAGYWLGAECDEIIMDAIPADFPGPFVVRSLIEG